MEANSPDSNPWPIKQVVLDTAAFVGKRPNLTHLGADTIYWTTPRVMNEIRDQQSKFALETFPFEIKTRDIPADIIKEAAEFSKKTGDFYAMSKTDLGVIALTLLLELEANERKFVRSGPLEIDPRKPDIRRPAAVPLRPGD
eukprot:319747_1